MPAGVDADHVPDLFRVVAADRKSVVVAYDRRVCWSRSVRTSSRCMQHIDNIKQFLPVRRVLYGHLLGETPPKRREFPSQEVYPVQFSSVQLQYLCVTQYYNKNHDGCADE